MFTTNSNPNESRTGRARAGHTRTFMAKSDASDPAWSVPESCRRVSGRNPFLIRDEDAACKPLLIQCLYGQSSQSLLHQG